MTRQKYAGACSYIYSFNRLVYISGFNIEEHDNPADFFLDVILGNVDSVTPERLVEVAAADPTDTTVVVPMGEESAADKVWLLFKLCRTLEFVCCWLFLEISFGNACVADDGPVSL